MAITTYDAFLAATNRKLNYVKTTNPTVVIGQPFALINLAGSPAGRADLNPGSITTGVIPVDGDSGFPLIEAYGGSNKAYLTTIIGNNTLAGFYELFDLLFWAGSTTIPTSGTTTVTLSPARTTAGLRGGNNDLTYFVLCSTTTSNHAHSFRMRYTDTASAAQTTHAAISTQNLPAGNMRRLNLANNLKVQTIDGYDVIGVGSATGTVSVMCCRSLGTYRFNDPIGPAGPNRTGFVEINQDAALFVAVYGDTTNAGIFAITATIKVG